MMKIDKRNLNVFTMRSAHMDKANIFKRIKWAFQRIKNGYSDGDLIDYDDYLAALLNSTLKKFAITVETYPDEYNRLTKDKERCLKVWKNDIMNVSKDFEVQLMPREDIEKYFFNEWVKDTTDEDIYNIRLMRLESSFEWFLNHFKDLERR